MKLFPNGPIVNKSALDQIMFGRRTNDGPLSEPLITQFTDVFMQHKASISLSNKSRRLASSGKHQPYLIPNINSLRPSDTYMRRKTYHHRFRYWLVAWPAPNHYLNQCWNIVNSTLRNILQWNFDRNFLTRKCTWKCRLPNGVHLSRPQCVKIYHHHSPRRLHTFFLGPVLSFPVTYQRNCLHK